MPIYEYQCEKCRHHLEALQKFSDKPLRECPACGKHSLRRLISAPMFRLAGSGWYETDFKSENERKRNLAGKDEAPPAEAATEKPASAETTETKAEAKPAPKAEAAPSTKSSSARKPATKSVARPKPAAKKKSVVKRVVRKR